jgi:hypothetical protein
MIGVSVMDLPRVPIYRQEQAKVQLQAQYEAKQEMAKQMIGNKKEPFPMNDLLLPEF